MLYTAGRIPGADLQPNQVAPASALQPNTELVARSLFGPYLLPFEIASLLLLVAMIGAVVMAKKKV
jgi:NADH:ubiquinone oxidoreductase subunit 6 (subunit J)